MAKRPKPTTFAEVEARLKDQTVRLNVNRIAEQIQRELNAEMYAVLCGYTRTKVTDLDTGRTVEAEIYPPKKP